MKPCSTMGIGANVAIVMFVHKRFSALLGSVVEVAHIECLISNKTKMFIGVVSVTYPNCCEKQCEIFTTPLCDTVENVFYKMSEIVDKECQFYACMHVEESIEEGDSMNEICVDPRCETPYYKECEHAQQALKIEALDYDEDGRMVMKKEYWGDPFAFKSFHHIQNHENDHGDGDDIRFYYKVVETNP